MVRRTGWMGLAGAVMLLALGLFSSPSARAESTVPAATPEDAVRQSVEAAGEQYAGTCDQTVAPRDLGKTCVCFIAEQDGIRAYLAGRTFSEYGRWVFVARVAGGWQPAGTALLDFFAQPDIPWPPAIDASHA